MNADTIVSILALFGDVYIVIMHIAAVSNSFRNDNCLCYQYSEAPQSIGNSTAG